MPDVKSQIDNMMTAYEKYVKGKTTSQGVSDSRKAGKASEKAGNQAPAK